MRHLKARAKNALPVALLAGLGASPVAARQNAEGLHHRFYVAPSEIRSQDTRRLAEEIVERIHRECEEIAKTENDGPVGPDSELLMFVPQEAFGSIARFGLKNQHVTTTTRGFDVPAAKFRSEQDLAMMRLPYDHRGRELLPKYALLNVKRPDFGKYLLPTRYGDLALVFKKEVMRRATWTYADSLDFSQRVGRFSQGGFSNPVLPRTARYRRVEQDRNVCGNYCEAQIWGELSLADVDFVMIRDSVPVSASVSASGLKIYRYTASLSTANILNPDQAAQYVRGEEVPPSASSGSTATALETNRQEPSETSPAVAGILEDRRISSMSDIQLIQDFSIMVGSSAPETTTRRLRLLGELATRPKTPDVVRFLTASFLSGNEIERSMALYGLTELPAEQFRPILLTALKDPSPLVLTQAIAFAYDQRNDKGVKNALSALLKSIGDRMRGPQGRDSRNVQQWLGRIRKTRACE